MRGVQVGSLFGIPIRFHWTFLVILPVFAVIIGWDISLLAELLTDLLAVDIDPAELEGAWKPWILGFVAAVGLFAGVILHELGHSLVAIRYGYEIESITLWLLGGLASLTEIPEEWRHEFMIAIAGPIVSVGVGVGCYVGLLLTPPSLDAVQFVFAYLALLNVFLAIFNMLPAFPMDGGRVLRALLARNGGHAKATQQAAEVGKIFAFVMGLIGLIFFNFILILLAFFIYIAAAGEAQQTAIKAAFEGITVAEVMTTQENVHVVTPDMSVADLMERMFSERHTGYPVVAHGDIIGLVTLDDTREVRPVERDAYRVADVMSDTVVTIASDANAMDALQLIQQHNIGRLPVIDAHGDLVGIISRTDLMTAFTIIQARGDRSADAADIDLERA